jgi:hypothetical protein
VAQRLNLTRQPLGNYFRATWESDGVEVPTSVLPPRFRAGPSRTRFVSSAIYNLFAGADCVVPLHRLAADEVWHAYGLGNACITLAQFDLATGAHTHTHTHDTRLMPASGMVGHDRNGENDESGVGPAERLRAAVHRRARGVDGRLLCRQISR